MAHNVIDLDDDAFFSMAAAAADEAAAAALAASSSKRQKLSSAATAAAGGPDSPIDVPEGPYMAALRGSRSSLWQQQMQQQPNKGGAAVGQGSGGSTGPCFTCGMPGHWSRDCPQGGGGGGGGARGDAGDVPEKACPCGIGSCSVLTSNTAKNPGRKFYRCPQRPESGGCNFFEWCDSPSSASPGFSTPRGAPTYESNTRGGTTYESYSRGAPTYESDSSVPHLECPCGVGPCLVLTAKTVKNAGRQFYSCPNKEGNPSCNFFKWCDEHTSAANEPGFTSQYNPSSQFSGVTGGPCYKCGKEGHWARDCKLPSSDSTAPAFTSQYKPSSQFSGTTGTPCFKCGKEGHWARDCTMASSNYNADARPNKSASSGSGTCFKCGEEGHWARDCPGQGSGAASGGRRGSDSFTSPYSYKSR